MMKDQIFCITEHLESKGIKNLGDFVKNENDNSEIHSNYSLYCDRDEYLELLNRYLLYLSLYKENGFIITRFKKFSLINVKHDINIKDCSITFEERPFDQLRCNIIYFDTTKYNKIKLEKEEQDIILLREIPFFIEEYFRYKNKKYNEQIIYMFSFLYLYHLIDYEFVLTNNELSIKEEQLFYKENCCSFIFFHILKNNDKKCLKKYTLNEKVMELLERKKGHISYLYQNFNFIYDHLLSREIFEEVLNSNGFFVFEDFFDKKDFYKFFGFSQYEKVMKDLQNKVESDKIIYLINKNFDLTLIFLHEDRFTGNTEEKYYGSFFRFNFIEEFEN